MPDARPRADGIARAFVSGTAWIGLGCCLQALCRLAFIAVLTKHLDQAHYGYWALVAAAAEILAPLATLGLTFGHTRLRAGLKDRAETYRHFLGTAILVACSGAAASLLLAALSATFAAQFMGASPLGREAVLAGAALILFTSFEWCLRFHYSTELEMGRRALLGASRFALELLAAVVGVSLGWGIVDIVLLVVAARALPQFVAFGSILRRRGVARPAFGQVPAAIRYGLPLQLALTAGTVTRLSDRLALGSLRHAEEVGAYSAIYEICAAHLMVIIAVEAVLLPVLSALANRGLRRRARWMYLAALKYLLIAILPAGVIISVAARPLLSLITRPAYVELLTFEHHWIAWGAVCYSIAMLARVLLAVADRTVLAMALMWGAVALKIVLLVVLIQWLGMVGAAIATFAAFAALMLATLVVARPYAKDGPPASAAEAPPADDVPPPHAAFSPGVLALTALAAALAGVPLYFLAAPTVVRLFAGLAAYGVTYAVALFALRAVSLDELRTIWRVMRASRT